MESPRPRDSREPQEPREARSWLLRFGAVAFAATLGAALAETPAAVRVHMGAFGCSRFDAWALLLGVALAPMAIAVVVARRARTGLAALGGQDRNLGPSLLAWIFACLVAFTALGAVLRARTHHRGLGGVAFAVLDLFLASALALVVARVVAIARRAAPSVRWALAAVLAAILGVLVAAARHRLASTGSPPFPPEVSAKLVDGLAFLLSAVLVSSHVLSRRAFALAGPPLATAVILLAVTSWRSCPPLPDTLKAQVPLFSWCLTAARAGH